MTLTPITELPVKPLHLDAPLAVVGFHLGDRQTAPIFRDTIPQHYPVAAWMLARVLTLQLRADMLIENDAMVFGTLGDGVCILATRDARQTLAVVRRELEKLTLLAFCQLGVKSATGWQCVWPGPEVNLNPLMDLTRMLEFHTQQIEQAQTRLAALHKLFNLPPPAAGGAAGADKL